MTPGIGINLAPELRFLELLEPAFELVDYFELTPETMWRRDAHGRALPNGYRQRFHALGERRQKPFVAHAVAGSLGTADARDQARQAEWLARLGEDHAAFEFGWCTDHLGATMLDGLAITLPVALPPTAAMAAIVRERLVAMQRHVPDTGFENSVFYFTFGAWLDEPAFFDRILAAPRTHLLLDLHNVFTMAQNTRSDAREYLRRIDCARVVEIHLSGGADSDPAWLPDGHTLRLDSHDRAVPEEVWQLYEQVLPRCTNLRGVTLERMESTVDDGDVAPICAELRRAREVLRARR